MTLGAVSAIRKGFLNLGEYNTRVVFHLHHLHLVILSPLTINIITRGVNAHQ